MYKWLVEAQIPCKLILDAAIGFYMEEVDIVLVGAEGLVENGGILNKVYYLLKIIFTDQKFLLQIGTYPLALCAKALNKPLYVAAESHKFVRLYPLKQKDIPTRIKIKKTYQESDEKSLVDYTPPQYITLLLTDLGTLTTAAVSDLLMDLYS